MAEGHDPPRRRWPFLYAVLTGSFGGTFAMLASALLDGMPVPAWVVLAVTIVVGILTMPVVAIALLVFGPPLTLLLRPALRTIWSAPLAVLLGSLCGKATFFVFTRSFVWGQKTWYEIVWGDPGLIYGATTGLAWWFFLRRWSIARHAADMLDATPTRP